MTSHGKKQCTGLQQSIQTGAIPTTAISNATFVATTTTTQPVKTYSDGAYSLDWIEGIDYIDFVFTTAGLAQENTYSAFGLSLDDQMVNFLINEFQKISFLVF